MMKILVVDADKLARRRTILRIDWNSLGCIVVAEASNGLEGMEAVDKFKPDLIITDIKMPGTNGLEMINSLRKENNDLAVIFLTACDKFSYAQEAVKLQASDYILKPFEDDELEKAVLCIKDRMVSEKEVALEIKEVKIKPKRNKKSKYIREALDYITENYSNNNLSVEMIARSVGISGGHLSRVFKDETGHTISTYITLYRIRQGIVLLVDCRYKVYEVAHKIGYKDVTYFSTVFKSIVGISPSDYQGICEN